METLLVGKGTGLDKTNWVQHFWFGEENKLFGLIEERD